MTLALAGLASVGLGAQALAAGATVIKCAGTALVTDPETGRIAHDKRAESYKFSTADFHVWKEDEQAWSENICARKQTTCTPIPGEYHVVTVDPGKDLTHNDVYVITQGYKLVEHKTDASDGADVRFTGRCAVTPDPAPPAS